MKIKSIKIENFRGITKEKKLSFIQKKDVTTPVSCIIYGDNGSGKSSFIDAIEFGLQCKVNNSRNFKNEFITDVRSLSSNANSNIVLTLEDESIINRTILYQDYGINNKTPHPSFTFAPFVLRRKDIIKFWDTPKKQRMVHLLSYFPRTGNENLPEDLKIKILELETKKEVEKQRRFEIIKKMANGLGLPINKIPVENKPFDKFVSQFFFNGQSKRQFPKNDFPNSEKYFNVNNLFDPFYKTNKNIRTINKEIKLTKNPVLDVERKNYINNFLEKVTQDLVTDFYVFSTCEEFIDDIKIIVGELNEVSLSFLLCTKNGTETTPQKILSEANLDLLAILIHLRIIKAANEDFNQGKVIILDDILQSVDYTIRFSFLNYLMSKFNDWQIIFTVHDRLWKQNLGDHLNKCQHKFVEYEIKRWEWQDGPYIIDKYSDRYTRLKNYINTGTVDEICGYSGYLLEFICEELSYILNLPLPRQRGEKYTLDPLWTAVKNGKLGNSSIKSKIENIDSKITLRNLLGAHYNDWPQKMTNSEVSQFGKDVLEFYKSVFCQDCYCWIKPTKENYSCNRNCKKIVIQKNT